MLLHIVPRLPVITLILYDKQHEVRCYAKTRALVTLQNGVRPVGSLSSYLDVVKNRMIP